MLKEAASRSKPLCAHDLMCEVSVHWHETEFRSGCAKIACIQLSSVVDLAMTMWHPHGIRVASWWHPGVFVGIHVFGPKKTLDFMWEKLHSAWHPIAPSRPYIILRLFKERKRGSGKSARCRRMCRTFAGDFTKP